MADFTIAPPAPEDEADWRRHWAQYLTRYTVNVTPLTTDIIWARMLDPTSAMRGLIARDADGRGIGFCHLILHDNTWSLHPFCYLEDMFIAPEYRRRGIGRAMLDRIVELAHANQWARVYWTTWENNAGARTLYDQVTGGADSLVHYTIKVSA
ncbi:GNAT family N-acetyltransferase [Niveispirillum fermenti]|uniref:GNAT family N-acetyltransferase n=1 Tax=Niveispirillum fermenti TaxID=1233113 RepID=UPI003A844D0E